MTEGISLGLIRGATPPAEASPSEHIAQFYADENELLDTLTEFVGEGLSAQESTIVIATPEHLRALRHRLCAANIDMMRAMLEDRYIPLDARVALTSFMVDNWPNERLFSDFIGNLLRRASAHNRPVRGFGEMVALLWASGQSAATVRLEQLWNRFCMSHPLSLLCAYPESGFDADLSHSRAAICAAHSRVI
jgi:hypothetical protein